LTPQQYDQLKDAVDWANPAATLTTRSRLSGLIDSM
jgi:hypothetical protein